MDRILGGMRVLALFIGLALSLGGCVTANARAGAGGGTHYGIGVGGSF